jgi:adenylate kinase
MARIVVLMGPQGAGKGTQAKMISSAFGLPVIATGDILREIAASGTPLGLQIRETQAAGRLVSDEILAEVVKARLSREDCGKGCILDGFPRTLPQAHLLETIASELAHTIAAISIEVPRELLYERLGGRLTCSKCGAIYHVKFKPSRKEGVCDLDGGQLFTRSDDNAESIAKRLALYDEVTRPLLDYYRESGRLSDVDGTGGPQDVFERLTRIIGAKVQP